MKYEGIVIKSIPYKEKSDLVYIYTNEGIISVKALGDKNSKNSTFGFREIGNLVSFVTTDNKFKSLVEYSIINSSFKFTKSIDMIESLSLLILILDKIPLDSNHNAIYNYVLKIYNNLEAYPKKAISIFLIKMLYFFGVRPNLGECISCNNKNDLIFFDINNATSLCKNCINIENNYKIWNEYYNDKKDIDKYNDTDFSLLFDQIKAYYQIHAHIILKI